MVKKNEQLHLTCPTCQTEVSLPDTGVAGLQTDLHAEKMVKRQKALKNTCENCKESTAVKYCQECKKFICEKCLDKHETSKDFSSHRVLSVTDTKSAQPLSVNCERHHERQALVFCQTCSELICGVCTSIAHKHHEYHPIDEVFLKHHDELTASVRPVKEMMDTVEQALKAYTTRATEIKNQKAIVEADIGRKIDQLHQLLDQRREDLVTALSLSMEQKLNELAAQRDQVAMTHKKVSRCSEYLKECLQSGEKDEVLKMKAPVLQRMEEITAEFDPDTLQPKVEADIQCLTDDKASQACQEFGSITSSDENVYENMEDTDFTLLDNQCYGPATCESIQPPSQATQQRPPSSPKPSGKKVRKPKKTVQGLHNPFGVAVNSKQQMIVVDSGEHRVLVMTSTGEKIFSFGKQGSGKGEFKQPCGVAVDSDDCIYVSDNNNHRVQKFTPDGRFVAAVGTCGNGTHQFVYPISICFNKTNQCLYVCDQLNHRIQVFTTDLTFVQSIGGHGKGNGKLNYPKSCAFNSSNNLYVADCSNNCVQVFTVDGEFVRAFPNDGTLQDPFAIATDRKDKVYVSELNRDQVKIFQANGKYVHSFGEKGTEEGQFRDIGSICFDENTTMIISDSLNNRLQLFIV